MRLVYFSPVPWASFDQRPHKFVDWLYARYRADVIWVDPYPTRLPMLKDFSRVKNGAGNNATILKNSKPSTWLKVLQPRSLPIEPLPGSGRLNRLFWGDVLEEIDTFVADGDCIIGIGKPSELALQALFRYPGIPSFYDAMDDFPAFYHGISRAGMARREREIAFRVSRISVSSTALAHRFSIYQAKLVLVFNACDSEKLPPINRSLTCSVKPVIGYVGTIGHWFDWPLVLALAEENSSVCFRLIGPVYVQPSKPMPPNIELLLACDHVAAMRAMAEFTIGLIPFKRIGLTASVDPIKYYEYRAMGLPVLSTRFGEMAFREEKDGVFFIDKFASLKRQVQLAMAYKYDINEIREFRKANSWGARFEDDCILP